MRRRIPDDREVDGGRDDGWRSWLTGRQRRFEPTASRDMKRLPDGSWRVNGPRPLIGLIPENNQRVPIGDVRFEIQLSTAESPSPFTLLVDIGAGFTEAKQVPLPVPQAGVIDALVTLPENTVGLGLHPGSLTTFRLDALGATELTAVAAVVAHVVPQVRRLMREPARFALLLARATRLLRQRGTRGVLERLRQGTREEMRDEGYAGWAKRYAAPSQAQLDQLRARLEAFRFRPTISLLLGSDQLSEARLRRTLEALERQVYPNWELCIADETMSDELRSVFVRSTVASQIRWASGTDPLVAARGELVARLAPGDALSPHALFVVAEQFNRVPNLALLYTDSDSGDAAESAVPSFKPDWSPAWLRTGDYIGRAAFFLTERVRALGGWPSRKGAVSQHELLLRYTSDLPGERISHVPAVLVHSPVEPAPTSDEMREGVRAVQASLDQMGAAATVESGTQLGTYRVRYAVPSPQPLVTVVIPTRDHVRLLRRCIQSVREVTSYRPLELLVVDNESREREAVAFLAKLEADGVARVLRYPQPFNYSAMNNLAAREAHGAVLCLLNNDVEAFEPGWLTEMVGLALQPGIGAVGAKLLYSNNTIQHAGMVAGLFGVASHAYLRERRESHGYLLQLKTTREVAAVTAACMVLRRDRFLEVGGLDEVELSVAFNDIDLCFKLLSAGYRNLWTPYAELYHQESASRGKDESGVERQRYLEEERVMRKRWSALVERDPYYNPNLALDSFVPRPAWPPRVLGQWADDP